MTPEQEQQLLTALKALQAGDFSMELPVGQEGAAGEMAEAYNGLTKILRQFNAESTRIFREVGGEGRFGGQAEVPDAHGAWYNLVLNLNAMSANLTCQVRDLSRTLETAARGGAPRALSYPVAGEMETLFRHAAAVTGPAPIK